MSWKCSSVRAGEAPAEVRPRRQVGGGQQAEAGVGAGRELKLEIPVGETAATNVGNTGGAGKARE